MGIQERKRRERERRKQQIMVAAKRVFAKKGYGRTTMGRIAKEAELSAGTLYLYFKSKSELWAALSIRVLRYLLMRLDHLLTHQDANVSGNISELKAVLLDAYEFDPTIFRNLFNIQSSDWLMDIKPELIEEIESLGQQSLNKIASIFQQGINQGIFLHRHPKAIADIVWSMFTGVVLWEGSNPSGEQGAQHLQNTMETAFEIFEKGILVSNRPST
jgi:AcrR family transcriptional regulator